MDIEFKGKYKSLTDFEWVDIPKFAIITGPNGSGKSQLLELINQKFLPKPTQSLNIIIQGLNVSFEEVLYLKSEWSLGASGRVNFANTLLARDKQFNDFSARNNYNPTPLWNKIHREIEQKVGKHRMHITKEEFFENLPEYIIDNNSHLSHAISKLFYKYRLDELDLIVDGIPHNETVKHLGRKPWEILREILIESKLPFEINDPGNNKLRDDYELKLYHTVLKEYVDINYLSSGEKVLMTLVFQMFNSQEKGVFPKLLLLDEPDAHLHPSMAQQFLNVVKNALVDKFDVQVLMTTHSPSTLILAPEESIFEMSVSEPRIKKASSKNHAVSLLTSGLIYVGEGTKYFLVEDKDDEMFYSYVNNELVGNSIIDANIPLVFIPASTKDYSGGETVVQNWVKKLQDSGINNIIHGLIDEDSGNIVSQGVYKINRYSIENYLIDPIVVYATLIEKEKQPTIEGLDIKLGEEYRLKALSQEELQKVADVVIAQVEHTLKSYFSNFDEANETQRIEVIFSNGVSLLYPKWILKRRGKTLLHQALNSLFTSKDINFTTLYKTFRKLNLFPDDLVSTFKELKEIKHW